MTRADIPDMCPASIGAAYLGIGLRTWYDWEKAGTLPTHRLPMLGRRVHYCGVRLRAYGTDSDIKARTAHALRHAS